MRSKTNPPRQDNFPSLSPHLRVTPQKEREFLFSYLDEIHSLYDVCCSISSLSLSPLY
jgi:hypothetical protein